MQKLLIAGLATTLLAMAGCADMDKQAASEGKPTASTTAEKAGLSPEARAALSAAQADVKAAKAQNALWTTAESALKAAEEAAAKNDSATVIKQAGTASSLAKLGLKQLDEPLVTFN